MDYRNPSANQRRAQSNLLILECLVRVNVTLKINIQSVLIRWCFATSFSINFIAPVCFCPALLQLIAQYILARVPKGPTIQQITLYRSLSVVRVEVISQSYALCLQ